MEGSSSEPLHNAVWALILWIVVSKRLDFLLVLSARWGQRTTRAIDTTVHGIALSEYLPLATIKDLALDKFMKSENKREKNGTEEFLPGAVLVGTN